MTTRIVELRRGILKKNDELAAGLRNRFTSAGVLVLKHVEDRHRKLVLLASITSAKFRRPVVPGDTLRLEMKILKRKASVAVMTGTATVDGLVVAEAEMMCKLADKEEAEAFS